MTINDDFNWFVSLMAVSTGTISAVIRNIPNVFTLSSFFYLNIES